MMYVRYGGKKGKRYSLRLSSDLVVVRTRGTRPPRHRVESKAARKALEGSSSLLRFAHAGVEVLRLAGSKQKRDSARRALKRDDGLRFAGRVLTDPKSKEPVIYTENFFIKFDDALSTKKARTILKKYKLTAKRSLDYAGHACFAAAPDHTGQKIFDIAERVLMEDGVELCHPELIRRAAFRAANPNQWHLKATTTNGNAVDAHANVEAAWSLSEGDGVIVAVIDDGMDINHEEFAGGWKIVSPRDVTRGVGDPRPFWSDDDHGTACAGVAVANGTVGAAGVAPKSRLMPIRLRSNLGSQQEADAFVWATDKGADVISCSWGPADGDPTDPNDPLHSQFAPLPDSTRLAIDYAIQNGRGGKGCVITWAAGNGNESVDNDGYAGYDKVIAVAACNDRGKRSYYSDKGDALWCSFPSSDFWFANPLTPGIWTTDRTGSPGYNPANYTDDFGGTSSACPGAAGVAALVLARAPDLRWDQVKEIMKDCCDRIDPAAGAYDASGHSTRYGYGRLNARKAVELAAPAPPAKTVRHTVIRRVAIKDNQKSRTEVAVADTAKVKNARIIVDIEHTYIGDLIVKAIPPGGGPITLHDRTGGSTGNLRRTYDRVSAPGLAALIGQSPAGTWKLEVEDRASQDTGDIVSFGVELDL